MKMLGMLTLAALLAAGGAGPGCNDDQGEVTDLARLKAMEENIDALIADAPCKGGDDCRAIAFGAKPCGGPWKYKVFSATAVDTTELKRLVKNYNDFNVVLNDRYGWLSDCSYVGEPDVGCVAGHCQVVTP